MYYYRTEIIFKHYLKIVLCIFFFASQVVSAQDASLEKKITININNKSIAEALSEIEAKEDYFFSYDSSIIKNKGKLSKNFVAISLRSILDELFEGYKMYYHTKNNVVYIRNHAKKGKIRGKIESAKGGTIPFVSIILKNTTYGTTSRENGTYSFSAPEGSYTIAVSTIGFGTVKQNITITGNETSTFNFVLNEQEQALDEVVVKGKTISRQVKEMPLSVNAIELKKMANVTLNLNEVLNRSTGVKVREQGGMGSDFEFSINGLSGKAVKFFVDGIPISVMGSSMTLNNIPINIAERVIVYKGVVPVHLGSDALGGAVNVITNQQVTNYLDAAYSLGSFNSHRASITGQYKDKKTGLITKASGFINYSDNNYTMRDAKVIKVIDEDNSEFVTGNFKRFHDKYKTVLGQLEVGLADKSWADRIFIGASFSETDKQIQTGNNQESVYGGVVKKGNAYSVSLRYAKKDVFVDKLDVSLFASLSEDKYVVIDTLLRRYYWDGFYKDKPSSELGADVSKTQIKRPKKFIQTNISYEFNTNHSLGINYTLDNVKNHNWNRLQIDKDYNPGKLTKHNLGLSYQQNFLNKKLTNSFFVKYYGLQLDIPFAIEPGSQGKRITLSNWKDYLGYGFGSRYNFKKNIGLKVSYEKAYRLQEVGEVFGNGFTVITNPDLEPESSHNINLGIFLGTNWQNQSLFFETGGFLRRAENFISPVAYQSNSKAVRYENTSKVLIRGLDAEVNYTYGDFLSVSTNVTYQSTINNTKHPTGSSSGTIEATYKNELPNRPWLFGNAGIGLGKSDVFKKKENRLQFNWDFQYVHWYYLTWESYASIDNISTIPDQYIHNTSLSYSFKSGKYNIALEGRNITDQLAFDNFKLQKPGRSFSVKFRYFIK